MSYQRVVITGFMGTGKTVAGKMLASRLKWLFFDIDTLAESTEGLTVYEIFEKKGEDHFRKLERRCLEGLVSMNEVVIATGGGTLLNPDNLSLATGDNSVLVCLWVSEEELRKRLSRDRARPLLKTGFGQGLELLKQREPHYRNMGHQIDTTGLSPEEVCDKILEVIGNPDA